MGWVHELTDGDGIMQDKGCEDRRREEYRGITLYHVK